MRIFIEIEVRMMPFAATKKQRNGIVVHREKRDGGSDIYMAKNAENHRRQDDGYTHDVIYRG